MKEDDLYPLFAKLAGRKVVLVGGGKVAASKLPALLAAAAEVTVVAPRIRRDIQGPKVKLVHRAFVSQDLNGAWFVIAAAPQQINREVSIAAEERQLFVNAVDDPANATVYLGGVVRNSGVTVAISTNGRSPALAGLIREGFEAVLPSSDLESWTIQAQAERNDWQSRMVPIAERRPLLLQALNRLYEESAKQRTPNNHTPRVNR